MDFIDAPVTRQRIVFTHRSPERVAGELFVAPGGFVPLHVHASQVERFEGVAGELRLRSGRSRRTLGAGDSVRIEAGVAHGFRNVGPVVAHFLIELMPPCRGEEGLRTLFGLRRDRRVRLTRLGLLLPLLQVAVLFGEYLDEVHLPFVPFRAQRLIFRLLGGLGRRLGYTAFFPEYQPRGCETCIASTATERASRPFRRRQRGRRNG